MKLGSLFTGTREAAFLKGSYTPSSAPSFFHMQQGVKVAASRDTGARASEKTTQAPED
jgi:hypothetical protein